VSNIGSDQRSCTGPPLPDRSTIRRRRETLRLHQRRLLPACSSLRASTPPFLTWAQKAQHIVVSICQGISGLTLSIAWNGWSRDGSNSPWSCHLSPGQVDRAPNHEDVGVWAFLKGRPHKCSERPAYTQTLPLESSARAVGWKDERQTGLVALNRLPPELERLTSKRSTSPGASNSPAIFPRWRASPRSTRSTVQRRVFRTDISQLLRQ
jgi:hypothetical protein